MLNHDFGEVTNLTEQHQALSSALQGVFDELLQKVMSTTEEGVKSAAYDVFHEKKDEWNTAAQNWVNSQGNLVKAVSMHNDDLRATVLGPASNVFRNIASA
jgi:hypothetical protein